MSFAILLGVVVYCLPLAELTMDIRQKRIFQSMAPDQKVKIALSLYYSAKELKAAGLRAQNPDWPEEKIQNKLRDIFLYART